MYIRLALAILIISGRLIQAQTITDSLAVKDSLYPKVDTVYIQQPPLIIKKQVVVHDTSFTQSQSSVENTKKLNKFIVQDWHLKAEAGLDLWVGQEKIKDSSSLSLTKTSSYSISVGKDLGSWEVAIGVGLQQSTINQMIEKKMAHYDSTIDIKTYPYLLPDGSIFCYTIERNGKQVDSCPTYTIKQKTYDTSFVTRRFVGIQQNVQFFSIPLRIGKLFKFDKWYINPEIWLMPQFLIASSSKEVTRLYLDKKHTSYKLNINAGREISKRWRLEVGGGYQGQLGRSSFQFRFVNLHLGIKYYLSQGTY